MKKNITRLILFLMPVFLLTANVAAVSFENTEGGRVDPVTLTGRTVTVSIDVIEMEDYIDYDPFKFQYVKNADFTWNVFVNGDKKYDTGDKDDWYIEKGEGYDLEWDWNVKQQDEITIKIELWDRDVKYDDLCDINGDKTGDEYEDRVVTFKYSLITHNKKQFKFHGGNDGTKGMDEDDDDARLWVTVSDNYQVKPDLYVEPNNFVWNGNTGDTYTRTLTIKNVGEPTSVLEWSIEPGINAEDWGSWSIEPNHGELREGMATYPQVTLKSSDLKYYGATGYIVVKSNGGREHIKIIFTSSLNSDVSNEKEETHDKNIFKKISFFSKFKQQNHRIGEISELFNMERSTKTFLKFVKPITEQKEFMPDFNKDNNAVTSIIRNFNCFSKN